MPPTTPFQRSVEGLRQLKANVKKIVSEDGLRFGDLCWVWRVERSLARAAVFCGRAGSFTTIYTRPMPVFKDLSRSY